jgi:pimeloyl-ACP methyl ester carboxylesterase
VAAHGLSDGPEGLCDSWRRTIGDRAWVLCPRGREVSSGSFKYDSGPALAKEIDAGLAALRTRYPGYVDDGPVLYAGFSLGAILGVSVVSHDPKRFSRAVLIEGGEDKFASDAAAEFAHGGGQRVLFACGLKTRVEPAQRAADAIQRAGASARVVFGKPPDASQFMHSYDGPVAEEIRGQLDWLLEGDPRWTASP